MIFLELQSLREKVHTVPAGPRLDLEVFRIRLPRALVRKRQRDHQQTDQRAVGPSGSNLGTNGAAASNPPPQQNFLQLLLFPEGTRFTPAKHQISEEFARAKNLKELKYHLQPRTKGFIASLPSMRGKVPALYNIEVAFKEDESVKPTMTSLLLGKSVTCHMYMQRIPMEEIPETEQEQDRYLRDLFQLKVGLEKGCFGGVNVWFVKGQIEGEFCEKRWGLFCNVRSTEDRTV